MATCKTRYSPCWICAGEGGAAASSTLGERSPRPRPSKTRMRRLSIMHILPLSAFSTRGVVYRKGAATGATSKYVRGGTGKRGHHMRPWLPRQNSAQRQQQRDRSRHAVALILKPYKGNECNVFGYVGKRAR